MTQDRFYLIYYNHYDGDNLAKVKAPDAITAIKHFTKWLTEWQGANFYSSQQRDPRALIAEVNSNVENFYIYEIFDYIGSFLPRGEEKGGIKFIG